MIRAYFLACLVLGAVFAAGPAPAAERPPTAAIRIDDPWVRASLGPGLATAAYVTLADTSGRGDALIGIESPQGGKAEAHETVMEGGIMKMRAQPHMDIPPNGSVAFKPGGAHIMITGLPQILKEGDVLPLKLKFEHQGEVTVNFAVRKQ